MAKWRAYVGPHLTDLLLGGVYLVVATALLLYGPESGTVRAVVAVPFLLFVPGYAVVSALFPATADESPAADRRRLFDAPAAGPSPAERLGLSFGLSVALIPLVGVTLGAFGVVLWLSPVVWSLATVSLTGLVVAAARRTRLPAERRFDPGFGRLSERLRTALLGGDSSLDRALDIALAAAVLFGLGVLGYGLVSTNAAETDSRIVLLTETPDGSLVAGGYPENISRDGAAPMTAAVHNGEGQPVDYTLVVQLQRVDTSDGTVTVRQRRELGRLQRTVRANGTWYADHSVSPGTTGTDLRLTYLLYRGPAPDTGTTDSAYRHTYIWINATRPSPGPATATQAPATSSQSPAPSTPSGVGTTTATATSTTGVS